MAKETAGKTVFSSHNIFLFLVLLAAGVLRLWKLGKWDFWYDEAHTLLFAGEPQRFSFLWPNSFLFDLGIMRNWLYLSDNSEFMLRIPSVFFSIVSLFVLYKFTRLMYNRKIALIAVSILAFSPFHIHYSQEIRCYSLLVLLTLLAAYFLVLTLKEDKIRYWLIFVIFCLLSLLTHYIFLLSVVSSLFIIFVERRSLGRHWIIYFISVSAAAIGFFPILFKDLGYIGNVSWIEEPSLESLFITFQNFNLGYHANTLLYLLSVFVFLPPLFSALLKYRQDKDNLFILSAFLFLPLMMLFIISLGSSLYLSRYIFYLLPFYYIIIAKGLYSLSPLLRRLFLSAVFILFFLSLYNYYDNTIPAPLKYHQGVHEKRNIKPAVDYIIENYKQGDIIAHANLATICPFLWYMETSPYYRGQLTFNLQYVFFIPSCISPWARYSLRESPVCLNLKDKDLVKVFGQRRLWLVASGWSPEEEITGNSLAVLNYLKPRYGNLDRKIVEGIYLSLYTLEKNKN
ncbi:MAG: hypothetical protein GF375_03220 [Candidatus Omnitrophica bacterium]|nr:hypothetical protein [Candidatus Omnitrophota bacterium]MBD3269094.1 hypothetical protein [Candidatus Omnitrophota bacterium]